MSIPLLAMAVCLPCHEEIVGSFGKTGMGRSIARPVAEAKASGAGADWAVEWDGSRMTHRVGNERRMMRWAVGSGFVGKSYLLQIQDSLFQSPLSWYSARGTWDLSPGFERKSGLDFLRPVTPDCLFCHAGRAEPVAGTFNRYAAGNPIPQPAITCERCHGNGDKHSRSGQPGEIVNPAKLAIHKRDSVCEQCHLSGVARVPNPGKSFTDFQAGMALEEVFSVYVAGGGDPEFKVVSHSEQLALSRCATQSEGKLWCGSCHDPHREPVDAGRWYQRKCESCHSNGRPHGERCTECHMPRAKARDGGHTVFTDHRIQKPRSSPRSASGTAGLRPWREPPADLRLRGLGLAYIGTAKFEEGYALLRGVRQDAEVRAALGLVLLRSGRAALAVSLLETAAKEQPANSMRRLNLAAALLADRQFLRAKAEALRALELEPLLTDTYVLLAEIEPERAAYWKSEIGRRRKRN